MEEQKTKMRRTIRKAGRMREGGVEGGGKDKEWRRLNRMDEREDVDKDTVEGRRMRSRGKG